MGAMPGRDVLGDESDDLVTFVAPSACGIWVCQSGSEKKTDKKRL
jgi:hypothetical protein